ARAAPRGHPSCPCWWTRQRRRWRTSRAVWRVRLRWRCTRRSGWWSLLLSFFFGKLAVVGDGPLVPTAHRQPLGLRPAAQLRDLAGGHDAKPCLLQPAAEFVDVHVRRYTDQHQGTSPAALARRSSSAR